ncbi:hypothetical protein FD755_024715 [Muntiacus reevesi]|uniref:ubiquitinyl hydrolase 1 n=1 Tax=Muntiacus reevesi TaxID=9886 RepID=A0A5N3UV82_MUNRE|nr:hypothetical protein FD755_024715 [Muntiacus reevesi]
MKSVCIFDKSADQVYGDQDMHEVVRKHCMDYLMKNADYFSNYVTEDFTTYINRKRKNNCHGNHIEMQAMAEMYNRPVEVYQYSTGTSVVEPINTFHGIHQNEDEPIRVSYHRNIHYNSVVNPNKATIGVGLGLPSFKPGFAEQSLMKNAIKTSEESWIEQQMLEDKKRATDWEATNEAIEEQVARESYLQWLRDQEKQARQVRGPSQRRKFLAFSLPHLGLSLGIVPSNSQQLCRISSFFLRMEPLTLTGRPVEVGDLVSLHTESSLEASVAEQNVVVDGVRKVGCHIGRGL